jgi:hypothetical protein
MLVQIEFDCGYELIYECMRYPCRFCCGFLICDIGCCWLSLLAIVLIHLCGLLLSCAGMPVATPVRYVCTGTPHLLVP